jgi:hypothetical protein
MLAVGLGFVAPPLSGLDDGSLVLDDGVAVTTRDAYRPAVTPERFAIAAVRFVAAALIALVRACVLPSRVLTGCLPGPRSPSRFSSWRAPSAVSASSGSPRAFVALLSPLASGAGSLHAGISWQRPLGESPAFTVRTATPLQARFSSRLFSHALSAPFIAASINLSLVPPGCGCLTGRCSGPGCYLVLPDCVQLATRRLPAARGSRAAERQR